MTEECVKTAASLLSAMDFTADPCQDFFQFACGTWNKKHVIPEDRSSISTFEVLADQLQVILKGVLEEAADERDNDATLKAKTFYRSCMNITQIRRVGDKPLRQALASLGGWPVAEGPRWKPPAPIPSSGVGVENLLGRLRKEFNAGILIEQWVGPDDKNSSANIIQVCLTEECVKTAASLLSAMDFTADPCQDFFQFACGTWNKKHVIPEDRSSISTFEVLADQLQVILKGVLEEAADERDNDATLKAKTFYRSCMNI
ncbi:hypothetical protein J437_LFUL006489, partial [Ladona fulva]